MKNKTRIKYSENFLNNQNYILGKTEKKKLLSKFFIEYKVLYIFSILSKVNNILLSKKVLFIYPLLVYIVIFMNSKSLDSQIFFGIIAGIFSLVFFIGYPVYKNFDDNYEIKSFKDYFFGKGSSEEITTLVGFFKIPLGLFIYIQALLFLSSTNNSLIIGAMTLFFFFYIFLFVALNIINTFLFVVFIFWYLLIEVLSSIIYVFLFKGLNGYIFLKSKPNLGMINKFDIIRKDIAKNKFFLVKQK